MVLNKLETMALAKEVELASQSGKLSQDLLSQGNTL